MSADPRARVNRRFAPVYFLLLVCGWAYAIADESVTRRPALWFFTILIPLVYGISLHAADRLHPIEDVRLWWMTRGR